MARLQLTKPKPLTTTVHPTLHLALCISLRIPQTLLTNPRPWKTCSGTPTQAHPQIPTILSALANRSLYVPGYSLNQKYNLPASLVPVERPLMPEPPLSAPPMAEAAGQSSGFLGVLCLALAGLAGSGLPAALPWVVAGKAFSCLVKLGPIVWGAMPAPTSAPSRIGRGRAVRLCRNCAVLAELHRENI
ncbi:hypothetical protein DSO57_1030687 [Entomophthora muscae]|uniref:Uncharacterized protein n=1 Tax=Entomophthora muscae TaxID=34485 RepID=A0ACC2RRY8_9FUNG|nr:hypothetical protein DSO57_1030687 [Entomophthora muscae]